MHFPFFMVFIIKTRLNYLLNYNGKSCYQLSTLCLPQNNNMEFENTYLRKTIFGICCSSLDKFVPSLT